MRWLVLAILLVPGASAASQVHLTYTGEAYAVTFRGSETEVTTPNASAPAKDVGGGWKRAELALGSGLTSYAIGARSYNVSLPPAPHETTRIVVVGDMGVDENASRIANAIANVSPDLVLIPGDLSYAHGDVAAWNAWFDLMEPLASRVPVMPAFGNHEHYCQRNATSFARCDEEAARWDQHFALPGDDGRVYAFDWGPLRVTTLDTEAYIDGAEDRATDPEEQERFLRDSLAGDASDRWDLVMYHRPLRTTLDRNGAALHPNDSARLEGILGASDLVFQAHVHAYERAEPTANGTVYVTTGGGGRELYDSWGPEQAWLATRASVHHFVVLDVAPGRVDGRTLDVEGKEIDRFTLARDVPAALRPPSPTPPPPATTPTRPATVQPTGATPATTPSENVATPMPSERHDTPAPMWPALVAVAAAVALTAWRRRRARPARG